MTMPIDHNTKVNITDINWKYLQRIMLLRIAQGTPYRTSAILNTIIDEHRALNEPRINEEVKNVVGSPSKSINQ